MRHRHQLLAFAGSVHFITFVTRARGCWFVDNDICRELLRVFEWYRAKYSLDCYGYVLMPDHWHALFCQVEEGSAVSQFVQNYKKYTSRNICLSGYPEATLWNDYFDDVGVPGPDAARTKISYMHQNPVRKGLVVSEEQYLWSSARDYCALTPGAIKLTLLSN